MEKNKLPLVKSGLSVTELGSELIVFDSATSSAHCLDKVGGMVFLACRDAEGYDSLEQRLGLDFSRDIVQSALGQLEELGLLERQSDGVGRRQFLSALGVGAAGIVVASVAAPAPVAAQSCDRCRLDPMGVPCDCSTCGQPCSIKTVSAGTPCSERTKGPCGSATAKCNFEYQRVDGAEFFEPGKPSCFLEGTGDYRCRTNTPYSFDCTTARALVPDGDTYYCCCCDPAGDPTRNCCLP